MKQVKHIRKRFKIFILLTIVFLSFSISLGLYSKVQCEVEEPIKKCITLEQNPIPEVNVYYDECTFVFKLKSFFIRVKPFVIYNGSYNDLKQIISFLNANFPDINYKWLVKKAIYGIHYGFNLTQLPEEVADKIDYLGFRFVDLNFPLHFFELKETKIFNDRGVSINLTLIHIPRFNLIFSFEDLCSFGYSIEHINSTFILIGKVKGRSNLFVDPITYSADIITVTGFTEISPCGFLDLYNADLTGELELMSNQSAAQDMSLTTQIQPADDKALKLRLVISNTFFAETVYVDDFNEQAGWAGWTRVGSSPYLDAVDDDNEVYTSASDGIGDFSFANLSQSALLASTLFEIYCNTSGNDQIMVEIWNGTWVSHTFSPTTSDAWLNWDTSNILDTSAKVDNAKIRLTHVKVGGGDNVFADCARINVTAVSPQVSIDGTDKDGFSQSETIDISANGNYSTTKWFQSVDASGIDCTGTFYIAIYQLRWGVVWQTKLNTQFFFDARLEIGDGSNETWFKDTTKQVSFPNWAGTVLSCITVKNNSHFILGDLINATRKTSRYGCSLISLRTTYATRIIDCEAGSDVKLYSCTLKGSHAYTSFYSPAQHLYNCIFDRIFIAYPQSTFDLHNVIINTCGYGIFSAQGSYNDLTIHDSTYALYCYTNIPFTLKGGKLFNNLYAVWAFSISTNKYLINCEIDDWHFFWQSGTAEIYRQYEHDFCITFQNGSSFQNANITITYEGQGGGQIGSWLTNSTGQIPTQTLSRSFYNVTGGDVEYVYFPYNITITASGMQTYTKKWIPIEKTIWEIALIPPENGAPSNFASGMLVGTVSVIAILIIILLLIVAVVIKK